MQTFPSAAVHGVWVIPNAGITISAIWIFSVCRQTRNPDGIYTGEKWLRIDPIDNQRGEIEYEDHGLSFDQVEVEQILVSMEDK